MNEILILTGACGVGKSTISREWAKLKKGAALEADYFTEWIFNDTYPRFSREEETMVAHLSCVVAQEYLKHGMPVVIENVWSPHGLDILKSRIEKETTHPLLKFVWLYCDIRENHRRDRLRVPENQMKNRVDIVNEELKNYRWGTYVHRIDTTELTIQETVATIERIAYL